MEESSGQFRVPSSPISKACSVIRNGILPSNSMRVIKGNGITLFYLEESLKSLSNNLKGGFPYLELVFVLLDLSFILFDKHSSERFSSMLCHLSSVWDLKILFDFQFCFVISKIVYNTLLYFVNTNMNLS